MPLDHADLKEMKKRADIEGLLNILETGDVKECREAICILGELRHKKAIRQLLGMLETDDIQIRSNAAWALGEIGDVKAVLPLIGLLNDPTENVRIHAAWSLGRIGDKRAIHGLKNALKNGSTDLRKHAMEAISKIESNGKGQDDVETEEITFSESIDIPLVTLNVPQDIFECNYKSMVESQKDNGNTKISKDILIKDKFSRDNTRRIVLGLKNEFDGLVSVDVVLRYIEGDVMRASSVWLQMSSAQENENRKITRGSNIESVSDDPDSDDKIERATRRHESGRKRTRITRKSRPVEYEPDEVQQVDENIPSLDDIVDEEYPAKVKKNAISRYDIELPVKETVRTPVKSARQVEPVIETALPPVESEKPEIRPRQVEPEVEPVKETARPPVESEKPEIRPRQVEPEFEPVTIEPKVESPMTLQPDPVKIEPSQPATNVDSAVKLLSHIGMSGMTNAASTVTQLSGQEADSLQSQLRTLPVDQMQDEINNLGESIVLIAVKLHGKGQTGDVNGEMQLYISKENALCFANELLCIPPDDAVKEFTEDIISTLKETTNIFGGQYISAISEYIEVPLLLTAPTFKTGTSSQIAESVVNDIKEKVEFVLATDLALGTNKTGRLIMLLDPASFEIIINKLF